VRSIISGPARAAAAAVTLRRQHLYDIAFKHNSSASSKQTDIDNPGAQQFYAELPVPVKESKLFYRIEGENLRDRQVDR
jgi:hypothetical protein